MKKITLIYEVNIRKFIYNKIALIKNWGILDNKSKEIFCRWFQILSKQNFLGLLHSIDKLINETIHRIFCPLCIVRIAVKLRSASEVHCIRKALTKTIKNQFSENGIPPLKKEAVWSFLFFPSPKPKKYSKTYTMCVKDHS